LFNKLLVALLDIFVTNWFLIAALANLGFLTGSFGISEAS